MFEKLYKLIFGLDEFTKTKIELRFELAKELIDKLEVNSIEDFDLLESCIYKIKDQLRVNSSNLNNTIKNTNNSLTKEFVEEFLQELTNLRSSFLNTAFTAIKKTTKPKQANNNDLTFKTQNFKGELKTEGGLHIKLESLKDEINFKELRIISSLIFELVKSHGTNIIIEDNIVYIIPRKQGDNILNPLPQTSKDIEEDFKLLTTKKSQNNDYVENVDKKQEYNSKYKKEEDLDSLIESHSQKNPPRHNEEKEEEKISFEKDDPIDVEKKEEVKNQNDGIEIEREEQNQNTLIIYQDDKIIVEANNKSNVFGEIDIYLINNEPISKINESDFSYMLLFSKIFSSVLFEVVQSHGTNILWDEEDSKVRIVPRFKDDGSINNIQGENTDDNTLNAIRDELIKKMSKEVEHVEEPKKIKQEDNDASKKKARVLLDELRKIP